MRTALLIAASLLATACGGENEAERADAGTAIAQPDAGGAFTAQPPSAQDFVQRVALSDMYEIEAANLALKKAGSGPTREFANMMITDHTKSTQALKDAVTASGRSMAMPASLDPTHRSQIEVLNGLDGEEFQREYMNQQMAAHRQALDLLKGYAAGGDAAELRQFAQSTIPTVQKHHEWLETNSPGSLSQRETPEATGGIPGATMTGATPAP